ncbi:hypothetical protein FRC12_024675 [Ceratobasidium sp. 428]|nr:hypothetical protein FRC12_024675 [Ceratobasidium sp. 428]
MDSSEQWFSLPYGKELHGSQFLTAPPQFIRGVSAKVGPDSETIREIYVFRLPSRNTNTGYESWHLSDLGIDAQQFKIDPDLDLLILLETDTPPIMTSATINRVQKIHLRSLQTGLPHPLAEVPVITSIDRSNLMFTSHSLQIVGPYMTLLSSDTFRVSARSWVSVWDWTTGILMTVSTPYYVDVELNGPIEQEFTPPTLLPRVYELPPSSYYLCLKIEALDIERDPIANGTLFVDAGYISKIVSGLSKQEPRINIPWQNWGSNTFWLNTTEDYSDVNYVAGQRATCERRNEDLDAVQILIYDLGPSTRNQVEDPPNATVQLQAPASAGLSYLESVFVSERGARRPKLVSLVTVPRVERPGELGTFMMDDEHLIINVQTLDFTPVEDRSYVYTF